MNRLLLVFGFLACLMVFAGPRPYTNISVVGTSTVYTVPLVADTLLMQCPGGSLEYRTYTAAECADVDGGALPDGGAFGLLVDFSTMSDSMPIVRASGQTCVGLLGRTVVDGGGTLYCRFATP